METIKKLFEKYSKEVAPSPDRRERIWNKVNAKGTGKSTFAEGLSNWMLKGKPYIAATAALIIGMSYYSMYLSPTNDLMSIQETTVDYISGDDSSRDVMLIERNSDISGMSIDEAPKAVNSLSMPASDGIVFKRPPTPTSPIVDNETKEGDRAKQVFADLVYLVSEIQDAAKKTYEYVVKYEGYVVSSYVGTEYANFTVKIPVEKFADFHRELANLADVIQMENIDTVDRQDEVTAIESSITEIKGEIAALNKELKAEKDAKKRAALKSKIETLEKRLTNTESNLKELKQETEMSTVTISFRKDSESFAGNLKETLKITFSGLGETAVVLINGAIVTIFFLIPLTIVGAVIKAVRKRMAKK